MRDNAQSIDTLRYQSINAERHLHPFTDHKAIKPSDTRLFVKGQGLHVWDSEGNRYLDATSGMICTAVGYGRKELVDAAAEQMRMLSYCSHFFNTTHPAMVDLSEKLFSLMPDRYSRVVYTNSGSEANEVMIRTVRHYWKITGKPQKKILISRNNGYHGSTVGSASLSGYKFMHDMGDLPIPGIVHIGDPYWFGYQGDLSEKEFGLLAARQLEEKILELGPENVAAFVAEPFQSAAGMIFPPKTYWPEIARICRQYDVLICADEVVGGFGRVGEWFAHQHFGFEPDTMSIAKGLTSGYLPMGGLVLSRRLADALADGGVYAHGLTYQGHPVPAALALANLKLLDEGGIVARVRTDIGPYFQNILRQALADHPLVGEIHGAGAAAGLQLAPSKGKKTRFVNEDMVAAYCVQKAQESGLLARPSQGRVLLAPALVATHAELDEIVDKLRQAMDKTWQALHSA